MMRTVMVTVSSSTTRYQWSMKPNPFWIFCKSPKLEKKNYSQERSTLSHTWKGMLIGHRNHFVSLCRTATVSHSWVFSLCVCLCCSRSSRILRVFFSLGRYNKSPFSPMVLSIDRIVLSNHKQQWLCSFIAHPYAHAHNIHILTDC